MVFGGVGEAGAGLVEAALAGGERHAHGRRDRQLLLVLARQALRRLLLVALHEAREHADEGGLARAVLPQHHHDLRICEPA